MQKISKTSRVPQPFLQEIDFLLYTYLSRIRIFMPRSPPYHPTHGCSDAKAGVAEKNGPLEAFDTSRP